MNSYPLSYNPILEYWSKIESGEEVVGLKIYKTYKKLVYDVEHPGEYFYSVKRANHILEFSENYCHNYQGKEGGKLVRLELWEKAMLAAIFGFVNIEGIRKYREAILIIGKKNGKSLLASIVGDYMLVADGEPGPEIYAVATKKDQAKKIWLASKLMVKKSPALRKRIKPLVSELYCDFNDGVFRPLASDSDTLDGLNVHCCLMDEIHQWKQGKALYDIMADGTTAREQPLIFITSTAGTVREDIYDEKYEEATRVINGYFDDVGYHDEHFIAFIYELDSRKEWVDPNCWKKANPGLGTIKSLSQLAEKVRKAKENPLLVKNLVCKEFNIRETTTEAWLTFEQLNNTDTFVLDKENRKLIWNHIDPETNSVEVKVLPYPKYGIGGSDLSETTDLTAGKVTFMVPGCQNVFVLQMYWLPEELLEKRTKEDKIPYDIWVQNGLMRTTPGNKVHKDFVTKWFLEVQNEFDIYIPWTGFDSWSSTYWVEEMKNEFGKESMIPVIQGKKTLSSPMKQLGADLDSKLVIYNNNPIDKWCLANTAIDIDRNDNIQPIKTSSPRKRIDGTAALLDAYVVLQDKLGEYQSMI
ncbi:MAG: terminase large subunit [Clostridium sp.]|uniref:terminase large subunit n=1 Tax=Clostridium sp. TaxID=1506 RepID=UPI0029110234|nr:terminase large subunit [Clostridium sp.]MDU7339034.1 terminase large subunit [Clostridium sp.]